MLWFWFLLFSYFYPLQIRAQTDFEDLQKGIVAATSCLQDKPFFFVEDHTQFLKSIVLSDDAPDALHLIDIEKVVERIGFWRKHLPSVTPFYALKVNPDHVLVKIFQTFGFGFDCASIKEIEQVLNLDVDPTKIVFAHPRKPSQAIVFAKRHGVKLMTFDSEEELLKMATLFPEGEFLLRIKTEDSHSITPLSAKFGATVQEAKTLLALGKRLDANIVGICFHVGSNCVDIHAYQRALLDARELFLFSESHLNQPLSVLDLGGGWPGLYDEAFVEIAKSVEALIQTFPPQIRFIAEPGRFFATKAVTIAMRVIGKRVNCCPTGRKFSYYLANGAYGFFVNSLYYQYDPYLLATEGFSFKPLYERGSEEPCYPTIFWGPTCDSGDKLLHEIPFVELYTGEYIYTENAGAYTMAMQTVFNQITPSVAYYICENKLTN
jgi:ornithine decarboxylase